MSEMAKRVGDAWMKRWREMLVGVKWTVEDGEHILKPEPDGAAHVRDMANDNAILWGPGNWKDANNFFYAECARAAIAAMREPTEAMLEAGGDPYLDVPVSAIWRAMIDAALK